MCLIVMSDLPASLTVDRLRVRLSDVEMGLSSRKGGSLGTVEVETEDAERECRNTRVEDPD